MPRLFHIPGVVCLLCAFVLLFLVSLSLPYLTALDFARVTFKDGSPTVGFITTPVHQLRFGTWAACSYQVHADRACGPAVNAYTTTIYPDPSQGPNFVRIGSSWTRGLAVHPVAAGVTLVALLLSLSTHVTFTLLASLTAFLAATLTLVAFAIDIALYAFVKHEMGKLDGVSSSTHTGPGFWLTFVSFLLLCFAGCTVCFGRRRDRMEGATTYNYSWKDRFRRA
ncbi:hypothetical protein C8Q77DRAFT_1158198 [Trametes polyzona]|nr:hypothetical protein C8Q77DRAFT_1158198 [Trametes polyzona]